MRLLPYAAPLAILVFERALLMPRPLLVDHFQFWAAGHLVATGRSPYDRASWEAMAALGPVPGGAAVNTVTTNLRVTDQVWLYPPQTALFFAPFGALPVETGVAVLGAFVLLAAAAALVAAARVAGLTGPRLAFALTIAAVSQPFLVGVRSGHPMGVVLGGALLVYAGIAAQRPWLVALGALLVSLKPQVLLVFAAAALVVLLLRRDARALATGSAALGAVTLAANAFHPFPVGALAAAPGERLALDLATTGALARDLGDGAVLTVALVGAAAALAVVAVRSAARERRGVTALAASLALSLAVSPYAHEYDHILLLPAAFAATALLAQGARAVVGLVVVAVAFGVLPWLLFFWWPLAGAPDRVYQAGPLGAAPLVALAALAAAALLSRAGAERAGARA